MEFLKFNAGGQWELVKSDKKDVWHQTVAFLAGHGDPKYKKLHSHMEAERAATSGKPAPKRELTPPHKSGTFHNEGTVTSGKVVPKHVAYPDKETGEMRHRSITSQEQHHWKWDHGTKKWNHTHTTSSGAGLNKK
jgi:hypothetical protein